MKAFLILEDGTVFEGTSIGSTRESISEIVFNTSMTGYLEVLTDPSYAGQAVVMTYPLIGNYGICYEDMESERAWPDGFIVRELADVPSNFRCEDTIQNFLVKYDIPGICGMAAAMKDACDHIDENMPRVAAMRDRLIEGLSKIPHSAVNGDLQHRLPGNVSFCFEGIEGESLLLMLDAKGICASSGSACTSGSLDPSHVLLAIGRVHDVAHGSLRLSLCEYNTMEEMGHIVKTVPEVVAYLRNMSPVWRDLQTGKRQYIL